MKVSGLLGLQPDLTLGRAGLRIYPDTQALDGGRMPVWGQAPLSLYASISPGFPRKILLKNCFTYPRKLGTIALPVENRETENVKIEEIPLSVIAAFQEKMAGLAPDTCWEYHRDKNPDGYSLVPYSKKGKRRRIRAHRLAYLIEHGEIPEGLNVLHHCDNPPCCNPAHLYAGTEADNSRDAVVRFRLGKLRKKDLQEIIQGLKAGERPQYLAARYEVSPDAISNINAGRTWSELTGGGIHQEFSISGDSNGNAKLTSAQVCEIADRLRAGEPQQHIADRYGVKDGAIATINSGKTWAEITGGGVKRKPLTARKLSEEQVRSIRHGLEIGFSQRWLADYYGVSRWTIGGISQGKVWKNVT